MDFSLDIGELTATIREYENTIKDLEEQKENINKAIKELTDQGWSGEAKDKFMENHIKKQEFYTNLIEKMKYEKNALESQEKPRAIQLKKRSENFEACIKRSGGGVALTNDDSGIISLQYGGQFPINNNIDECTNDYYRNMNSKFVEILNLVNSLTFTTFPIAGDVFNLQTSLRNQTESLTDFKASFNEYCNSVRDMEDNICSVFSKISGITEGISKIRGMSIISENGQVDKDKVIELMLKDPDSLTNEEKEILAYVEKVLGEEKYAQLKKQAADEAENIKLTLSMLQQKSVLYKTEDYIEDPRTGDVLDLDSIYDKDTRERIKYLMKQINTMNDTDKVDEGRWWTLPIIRTRQDYIDELNMTLNIVLSPDYANTIAFRKRADLVIDGTCEAAGGATEVPFGWTVMTGGSVLTEGLGTGIAVPTGIYLMGDGSNSFVEGLSKLKNAAVNPNGDSINLLKSGYKKWLGPVKGELAYNGASMVTATLCLANDAKTLQTTMVKEETREIPRKANIAKAFKENLQTEDIVVRQGSKTVTTTQVIGKNSKTPMILKRVITEDPVFDIKSFNPSKVGKKDFIFTGVDIRNTFNENGTVKSFTDSADAYNK
ncbi:hypothetical protein HBE96_17970 [Clostridium sp. P21]|uniref:WXG100 family type VII secretion target n=1 Tax=Clostridium muellerianum TaxID=2716538 RepID=A0A7Y0EJA0_9CLOT|nr:hypothetical protein [Clostridium muellerianum]NMM64504.1 hypothetical protein [Clostridium muellerianum]